MTSSRSSDSSVQVKQALSLVDSTFKTEDHYCPVVMEDRHQRDLWDCWSFLYSPEVLSDPLVVP